MWLLLLLFIVLIVINMPIAFVIGISGSGYFLLNSDIPWAVLVQRVVAQTQSFTFLAVPFFLFAGNLMNETGITKNLLSLSRLLTRRMYGSIAQVNVILSTLMGGISGSATADAGMEIRVLGPEMDRLGYPKGYTAAVTCLSSLITATIPPSLGLILYGFVGEVSIGKLFVAGIIPGLIMCGVLMITVNITSRKRGFEVPTDDIKPASFNEILDNLKSSVWALLFPLILILGIRFGFFTPSEAGAFAVVYALFVGIFIYKELTWEKFKKALINSIIDNGAIILIIAFSGIFSYALTYGNVPTIMSKFILGLTTNPQAMVLIMLSFLFITGMLVDSNVNILLLTPIFLPVVQGLGIDPVHFGICMMTIVTMGIMTPPVGTAVYIVCGIHNCSIQDYVKESLPFFAAIIIEVIILVFVPQLTTFLPNLLF
ncbi:TRAP transporter large permease [Sphaerochaeta sp. PS]|uniref:TRAP transporter large permease n=1 Tax=Sphaerochaeta sp. PS TaxID=3076336 RepID=UPI0028A4331D|nr:TRAP transporter large permease [Sphaerochaeta sp. PS]MDT4763199.1 TRAP transporter large permease [Sphaerochaeta sp. PS]